jgi:hypothetical protein
MNAVQLADLSKLQNGITGKTKRRKGMRRKTKKSKHMKSNLTVLFMSAPQFNRNVGCNSAQTFLF